MNVLGSHNEPNSYGYKADPTDPYTGNFNPYAGAGLMIHPFISGLLQAGQNVARNRTDAYQNLADDDEGMANQRGLKALQGLRF